MEDIDMMDLTVLTPDQEVFHGKITSVKVPGSMGQFQVLKNHAPIVSSLDAGTIHVVTALGEHRVFNEESGNMVKIDDPGKTITFDISGGFVEVLHNEVSLLVRGVKNLK
ncbi:MAG: hypothetical protein DHS20C18_04240 [Saprospiraceae bacterium]|nr:MAG: hypothetical protein DHS20C18_04240 [Saprospiraceae bacterium]